MTFDLGDEERRSMTARFKMIAVVVGRERRKIGQSILQTLQVLACTLHANRGSEVWDYGRTSPPANGELEGQA